MSRKILVTGGIGVVALAALMYILFQQPPPQRVPVEVVRTIIDDSEGNNNGRVNPGESVKIRFELRNAGTDSIPASSARLSTTQPGVHITDNIGFFPPIPPGETVVLQSEGDPFAFSIDDTVTSPTISFLLESPYFIAAACVQNHVPIYACVELCQITRNPDRLRIRLSICNELGSLQSNVAAEILDSNIKLCSDPSVTFTTSNDNDQVFYGNIPNNHCGVAPDNVCPPNEFQYMVSLGNRAGPDCIHFFVQIFSNAPPTNCRMPAFKIHKKTVEVCCQVTL
jgi:hypothetical protein